MKTVLSIAVGLMLLFSNTMVLAAPPSQKTAPVVYTVTVINKSAAPLNFFDYGTPPNWRIPTLKAVSANNQSKPSVFKIVIKNSKVSTYLSYGYDDNNFCRFRFSYNSLPSKVATQGNIDCKLIVTSENNNATITIRARPSMFCVKNITKADPLEPGTYTITIHKVTKDNQHSSSVIIKSDHSKCWSYNKNISFSVWMDNYSPKLKLMTASTNTLSQNNTIQVGLINRVKIDVNSSVFCDYPTHSYFKKGNMVTVKYGVAFDGGSYINVDPSCLSGGTF